LKGNFKTPQALTNINFLGYSLCTVKFTENSRYEMGQESGKDNIYLIYYDFFKTEFENSEQVRLIETEKQRYAG